MDTTQFNIRLAQIHSCYQIRVVVWENPIFSWLMKPYFLQFFSKNENILHMQMSKYYYVFFLSLSLSQKRYLFSYMLQSGNISEICWWRDYIESHEWMQPTKTTPNSSSPICMEEHGLHVTIYDSFPKQRNNTTATTPDERKNLFTKKFYQLMMIFNDIYHRCFFYDGIQLISLFCFVPYFQCERKKKSCDTLVHKYILYATLCIQCSFAFSQRHHRKSTHTTTEQITFLIY